MHKKIIFLLAFAAALAVLFSGCLSVEKKEYRFKVKPDGSGEGTIRFVNLLSQDDNGKDVSFKDFAELVTDYLNGTKFEDDNANMKVTGKKLFEENGSVVGEVNFTFSSADSIGLFNYKGKNGSFFMHFGKSGGQSETVYESNGKIITGVSDQPFVIWDGGVSEFTFKTKINEDTTNVRKLTEHYKNWKK
jgi:hypothetical protein